MSLEPYRWYDPFALAEQAEADLRRARYAWEEADELERRTGRTLNAMARAHEYDTHAVREQRDRMIRQFADLQMVHPGPPTFIVGEKP